MSYKNLIFIGIFFIAFLALAPQLSGAAGCPRPSAFPTGILNYSCITYTNSQSTAFASNVEVNVIIPEKLFSAYTAANVMNQEFFFQNGTVAFSWMEGNYVNATNPSTVALNATNTLLYWVNTQNQQTGTSTSNYIYLGFGSKTSDFYNAHTGVNPTIYGSGSNYPTTTYGGVDNGKYVFPQYWNFTGTSIPSGWETAINAAGSAITVNDGVTVYSNSDVPGAYLEYETNLNPQGIVVDSDSSITQVATSVGYTTGQTWFSNLVTSGNPTYQVGIGSVDTTGNDIGITMYNGANPSSATITTTSSTYKIFSLWMTGSNAGWEGTANYINPQTVSATISTSTWYLTLAADSNLPTSKFSTYWLRTRVAPPNNQQPSYTISSAAPTSAPKPTINFVTPIQYGLVDTITATASSFFPNNDIAILINGKVVSSGTGSTTYNICNPLTEQQCLPVGVQNVNAIDLNSANTLFSDASITITQNITTLSVSTTQSNQAIPYSVNTIGAGSDFPVANQITYNLWLNNNIVGTTTSTSNTAFFNLYNLTGCWSWVFNTVGNANYIANSVSASQWCGYVPLKLQNTSNTWSIAPPSNTFLGNFYYPYKLYTQSPSNQITFNLNQTYVSTKTILNTGVFNISYVPPANQPSGNYIYGIKESEYANSVSIFESMNIVNMTDVNSIINYSSQIQYFPILAHTPTWVISPTSWYIVSSNVVPQITQNTITGAVFSTNVTGKFSPQIHLVYPFTSFLLNYTNNPKVQNSITISAFSYTLANSVIAPLRNIANLSIFNQETFNSVPSVNATFNISTTFNNYIFANVVQNITELTGKYFLYMPKSNYLNPNITFQLNGTLTKPLFFTASQLFCPTTVNSGSAATYSVGMVDTNGTKYSFYVYTSTGSSAAGYLLFINELQGVSARAAESLLIPASLPMAVPLEQTGQEYQYIIYSPNCKNIYYKGSFVDPTNPTYLTLTTGPNQAVFYNTTNVTGACALNTTDNPYKLVCAAADPDSKVFKYELEVFNSTNVLGATSLVRHIFENSSTFSYNSLLPINQSYSYALYAYAFKNLDPTFLVNGGPLNIQQIQLSTPLLGVFAFILMITLVFVGIKTGKVIILMLLTNVGLLAVNMLNLIQVPTTASIVFIVVGVIISVWSIKVR
jgi:hypothetical protein